MTEDTNTVDIEDVNLGDFEQDFFQKTAKAEPKEEVVDEDVEDDVDENEDDNPLAPDEDEDEEPVEEEDEDEEEPDPTPKAKKRNRTQERIEKLVAEARQAERERDALRKELEAARAEKENVHKEEPKAVRQALPAEAPNPDAKDENGEPLYELGEFDPKFIRDLTKFTIEQETKAAKEAQAREAQAAHMEAVKEEITNTWIENLDKAEEEIPDIRENVRSLANVFQDINPDYGDYLASTIMVSDYGPQIMNYLSQNIGEAQKIVASGPAAATLALGRLEAKFIIASEQEKKRNTKQVSKAPEPPENVERARGRGGRFTVAPDTDDLNAFERVFYQK